MVMNSNAFRPHGETKTVVKYFIPSHILEDLGNTKNTLKYCEKFVAIVNLSCIANCAVN